MDEDGNERGRIKKWLESERTSVRACVCACERAGMSEWRVHTNIRIKSSFFMLYIKGLDLVLVRVLFFTLSRTGKIKILFGSTFQQYTHMNFTKNDVEHSVFIFPFISFYSIKLKCSNNHNITMRKYRMHTKGCLKLYVTTI